MQARWSRKTEKPRADKYRNHPEQDVKRLNCFKGKLSVTELLHLFGYALISAGTLCLLYVVLNYFITKEEERK